MKGLNKDYSKKWHVMAAVAIGIFLATIDSSIVNVALPTLVRELRADFPVVQWVVLAYLLVLTSLMLVVGRLADMRGKKAIYSWGIVIFTAGSVLCGLSSSVYMLVAFRGFQAVGAAMILALSNAIVTEAFPADERGQALGISGTMVSVGIVVGPTLGGILLSTFSWRWIFFVNLPVGMIGILLSYLFIPSIQPEGRQRFDWRGTGIFVAGLLAFLLALTWGQRVGFSEPGILILFGFALICMLGFYFVEKRTRDPVIDLGLFQNRDFSVGIMTGFLSFVAIAGTILLVPFFLEDVMDYDALRVGFIVAVVPFATGFIAPIAGSASDRFGSRPITLIGLSILALGYFGMSRMDGSVTTLQFIILFFPIGLGMGIFQSPNNSAIMGASPSAKLGVVSSMLAITRTLGQTTGISVLGALWASRALYHDTGSLISDATQAARGAQASALSDTLMLATFLILAALMAAIWAFRSAK